MSMQPQVFRPRPLDIDTPMPVIIQSDPDDEEELKTDKKLFKKRDRIPIPIPVYTELENYDKENSEWKRPDSYVIYHEKSHTELEETVEYEMDSEDERFVNTVNEATNKVKSRNQSATRNKQNSNILSDDGFEKMMDVLEKEAFRKMHKIHSRSFLDYLDNSHKKKSNKSHNKDSSLKEIESSVKQVDDVPCSVCNDEDWDEANMIVFCDGCELAVHQTCYGVPQIPPADWYCRRCEAQGRKPKGTIENIETKETEEKEEKEERDEKDETKEETKEEVKVKEEKEEKEENEENEEKEEEKEQKEEKEEKEEEKQPSGKSKITAKGKGKGKGKVTATTTTTTRGKGKGKNKENNNNQNNKIEREIKREKEYECVLCGKEGGAMKRTINDGEWAHVLCALWIPDAAFLDATIMEPIDTSNISKDRFGLQCEICGTKEGCSIQCRTRYCYTAFHPFCASGAGLLMEMRTAKGRPNNLLFKTHCTVHSQEIRAERGLEAPDKYAEVIGQVCSEEIKVGLHQLVTVPQVIADAVCNFWLAKRQKAKHKDRPLLSRLQMEEDALKHEAKKKRSAQRIQAGDEQMRLRELRRQMDRALIILDVLKKREMYKREYVKNLQEIFEALVRGEEYTFTGNSPRKTPKKLSMSSDSTTNTNNNNNNNKNNDNTTNTPITRASSLPPKSPAPFTISKSIPAMPSISSFASVTSPSTTSLLTPIKKTPVKSTQLSLDNFFKQKNNTPTTVIHQQSPLKQKKLSSFMHHFTTPPRKPSPTYNNSSSDESLALPHAHTPDTASRKRKARRSLSPELVEPTPSESSESDFESEHSSSENEDMVPKSRAHLRRAANQSDSNSKLSETNSRKSISPERTTAISKRRKRA